MRADFPAARSNIPGGQYHVGAAMGATSLPLRILPESMLYPKAKGPPISCSGPPLSGMRISQRREDFVWTQAYAGLHHGFSGVNFHMLERKPIAKARTLPSAVQDRWWKSPV